MGRSLVDLTERLLDPRGREGYESSIAERVDLLEIEAAVKAILAEK